MADLLGGKPDLQMSFCKHAVDFVKLRHQRLLLISVCAQVNTSLHELVWVRNEGGESWIFCLASAFRDDESEYSLCSFRENLSQCRRQYFTLET